MKVPLLDLAEQNQLIRPEIEAALARVLDSNAFILGPEVKALEKELAEYCGVEFAVACASGSDALLLALMALDTGAGDKVITTPYSFFASVSAITRLGSVPVFVDIDPQTYNIDAAQVESELSENGPSIKSIEPVHLYGQCADMSALTALSEKYGVPVVEDAAQAIGAEETGRRAGSFGAIGCFSFYPSKNLGGMGDGGFLSTNSAELAEKLNALRVHGARTKYYHDWVGLNSRLDGFQGAVLRAKLPHLDNWTEKRQENAARYRKLFAERNLENIELPFERENVRHIYNQFVIRISSGRDKLRDFLLENGIGCEVYYPVPLHLQECFKFLGYKEGDFPEAESAAKETLAIPIYPELKPEQQEYVVEKIAQFCK